MLYDRNCQEDNSKTQAARTAGKGRNEMRLTDGKRIVEINLYEKNSMVDGAQDYFNAGNLQYDEETDTYKVDDIDYCIGYAKGEEDPEYGWDGDIVVTELEPLSEVEALARDIR